MSTLSRLAQVLLLALLLVAAAAAARAGEVRIAVAANFTDAAKEIGAAFDTATGHHAVFSFASTGQLFAQITGGAPFDIFLAADRTRPQRAVAEGLGDPDHLFTYAKGRLALYSRETGLVTGPETLDGDGLGKLAIANPQTAPYGAAAMQVLTHLGKRDRFAEDLVQGANIAQTYQFVATGNARLGLVAASQVAGHDDGSRWMVPDHLHDPIAQDAVLLKSAADRDAALAFMAFLKGPQALAILDKYGYAPGG
ncbi:molybdate ABC transporter substrate-binding protein [Thalassobaculum salexigens]|uniref:molybdate ABC transporter substrate-binding protein n=1 Tax=Thalassobaculum salexigens TaxID=455360 RepID=UPI0003F4BF28|nr:molybdate ABC transporter substrate-binding protein [Thalassobaculum salexigens]